MCIILSIQYEEGVVMSYNFFSVVEVDSDKCVNCHKCISVCPVKYCNDGSGDSVEIISDLCIGCGNCIEYCSHDARLIIDDFNDAMYALENGENVIAIVAPAIAANFPDYLRFNGWLKSIGIQAVFDVSFGAELTVKSYIEHIKKNKPKAVIAQPCPAIVTYIEIYKPGLLKYLAPADSPMAHIMKMIKNYYPQYSNHKIFVVSPCIAKKREFEEIGIGDYNVTLTKIYDYFVENNLDINKFPEVDFDNDPAERAVLFSTPGGLMRTAMRDVPGIENNTRKIEGVDEIYGYLDNLETDIENGNTPLLIDCLNCFSGCNGGTGTKKEKSLDFLEHLIEKRNQTARKKYHTENKESKASSKLKKTINKYWDKELYVREYINASENYTRKIRIPSEQEINDLYLSMHKVEKEDIKNCASCGYNTCESMAIAILNGLNKKENCHVYLTKMLGIEKNTNEEIYQKLKSNTENIFKLINSIVMYITDLAEQAYHQNEIIDHLISSLDNMNNSIHDVGDITSNKKQEVDYLINISKDSSKNLNQTTEILKNISKDSKNMFNMINIINDVNERTNVLAVNAAIESARAGTAGKRFSIIANEVRKLANSTQNSTEKISNSLENTVNMMDNSISSSLDNVKSFERIINQITSVKTSYEEVLTDVGQLVDNSRIIISDINELSQIGKSVKEKSEEIDIIASKMKIILEDMAQKKVINKI